MYSTHSMQGLQEIKFSAGLTMEPFSLLNSQPQCLSTLHTHVYSVLVTSNYMVIKCFQSFSCFHFLKEETKLQIVWRKIMKKLPLLFTIHLCAHTQLTRYILHFNSNFKVGLQLQVSFALLWHRGQFCSERTGN